MFTITQRTTSCFDINLKLYFKISKIVKIVLDGKNMTAAFIMMYKQVYGLLDPVGKNETEKDW